MDTRTKSVCLSSLSGEFALPIARQGGGEQGWVGCWLAAAAAADAGVSGFSVQASGCLHLTPLILVSFWTEGGEG